MQKKRADPAARRGVAIGVVIALVFGAVAVGGIMEHIGFLITCGAGAGGAIFAGTLVTMRPLEMAPGLNGEFLRTLRHLRTWLLGALGATLSASVLYQSTFFFALALGIVGTSGAWIYISYGQMWKFKVAYADV